jgi:tetratricopeptide (TPR) repeat protein
MALRYAMARDFRTHRRWALRLFLVVSASWFLRVGFFLSFLIARRPFGFDPTTLEGPFATFMVFGQYLVPLAILEVYFWAQNRPGALRRVATAALLFVAALGTAAGLFGVTMAIWLPQVKAGFDPRTSIAETLSATIASSGVDAAVKQYYDLKAAKPPTYNFDEDELNSLGYQLIRANKFKEAIRILELNVEAYPQSSNVYDSLGEAYMDDGNKPLATANYEESLHLNPKNTNGMKMLAKLKAQ